MSDKIELCKTCNGTGIEYDGAGHTCTACNGLAASPPAPVAVVLPSREVMRDLIAEVIGGDTYDCTRVWSAWGVGTMSEDDFVPLVEQDERLYELADACLDKVKELIPTTSEASNNLRNFANAMIDIALDGGNADGPQIQELAVEHGLLKPEQRSERCGDACSCAEYADFPVECFRKVKELNQ